MSIRQLLSDLVRIGLEAIEPLLPRPRVIYDRLGESPYLSRYYLFGGPRTKHGQAFDDHGDPIVGIKWRDLPVNLYLHKFHRGDDDEALHSHPWKWSCSFILAGGYSEERRVKARASYNCRPEREGGPCEQKEACMHSDGWAGQTYAVVRRVVKPFSINFIGGEDFHRVDLLEEEGAWSLFLAGPKASSWYFWDRYSGKTIPWRTFIFNLRHGEFKET